MHVVLDANVLYSETVTDVFVALAAADLLAVIWSDRLHEEWALALGRNRPEIDQPAIEARGRALQHARNWTCITVDTALIETLVLPDCNDRHVLAAAVQSGASAIVTSNLRDFPKRTLAAFGVSAMPADAVLKQLLEREPESTVAALSPNGAVDIDAHLERLRRAGLARSVKAWRVRLNA